MRQRVEGQDPLGSKSGACHGPKTSFSKMNEENSLVVVQWLGLHAFTAGGRGSVPCQETKILYATKKKGGGSANIYFRTYLS